MTDASGKILKTKSWLEWPQNGGVGAALKQVTMGHGTGFLGDSTWIPQEEASCEL